MVRIEPIAKKNLKDIVDIETSSQEKWYYYKSLDEKTIAKYDDLSPEQRWFHGGATMDLSLFIAYYQELEERFNSPIEFYIAKENKEILGFSSLILGNNLMWGPFGYIDLLMVKPEHRRKGIGKKLVQKMEERVKEEGKLWLYVYPENLHSDSGKFYQALGFTTCRERYRIELPTQNTKPLTLSILDPPAKWYNTWVMEIGWIAPPIKNWILLQSNYSKSFFEQKKISKRMVDKEGNFVYGGTIRYHPYFSSGEAFLWLTIEREDKDEEVTKEHIAGLQYLGKKIGLETINLTVFEQTLERLKDKDINQKVMKIEPLLHKRVIV
jgi:ribosomal protein S18 acetylase RimI-like enzyme